MTPVHEHIIIYELLIYEYWKFSTMLYSHHGCQQALVTFKTELNKRLPWYVACIYELVMSPCNMFVFCWYVRIPSWSTACMTPSSCVKMTISGYVNGKNMCTYTYFLHMYDSFLSIALQYFCFS